MAPTDLSDDFIANVMAQDARQSTIKYSALGMQALLPKRSSVTAPKANTRFLKNIIRETDSHNAALKAKEAAEARSRLRKLSSNRLRSENEPSHGAPSSDPTREGGKNRKRSSVFHDDEIPRKKARRDQELYSVRRRSPTRSRHMESTSQRGHDSEKEDSESDPLISRQRSHHHHHRHRHHPLRAETRSSRNEKSFSSRRSRSRSSRPSHDRKHRHRHSRRLSPSPTSRSRSPVSDYADRKHRKTHRRRSRSVSSTPSSREPANPPHRSTSRKLLPTEPDPAASDSDPLAPLLGPPPPPKTRPRGRGTFAASTSAIDTHFNPNYDPAMDAHPNSASEDDWDQALEALRDRQRWKQQGAERLRAAGFTAEEVGKWEKGGEKTEEDVRWTRSSEGREWDRGKGPDGDSGGLGGAAVEWGRLEGT